MQHDLLSFVDDKFDWTPVGKEGQAILHATGALQHASCLCDYGN